MVQKFMSPRPLTGGQAVQDEVHQKSLVDWLQVTFKGLKTWSEILTLLGLEKVEFNHFPKAYYGYQHMYGMGNINIMYNNEMDEFHVQMTGQGCRMFEAISEINWRELFLYIHHEESAKLTRLDLAIDDFKGCFAIPTIRRKMKRGELVTKFLEGDSHESYRFSSEEQGNSPVIGDGVRFGSPKSRLMIRMYDKVKERNNAGFEVTCKKWVRVELQLRKEYANEALAELVNFDFMVGKVAKGYLKEYLRFVDQPNSGKDTRKRRWPVSNFWKIYLGKVEPLALSLEAPDATIERTEAWLDRSVIPSLAMIFEAKGAAYYNRLCLNAAKVGKERFKDKHEIIVNDYLEREKIAKMKNKHDADEMKKKMATIRKNRSQKQNEKYNRMVLKNHSMNSGITPDETNNSVLDKKAPRITLLDD